MSKINLIPEVKQEQIRIKKLNVTVTSVATVTGIIVAAAIFILFTYFVVLKAQIASTESQTNKLNEQLKPYAELEKTVLSLETGLKEVKGVLGGGPKWTEFFAELEKATPGDIRLTSLSISNDVISMSVEGKDVKSVDRFIKSFSEYKVNEKNLFTEISVKGFSYKSEGGVTFQANMNLVEGAIWN